MNTRPVMMRNTREALVSAAVGIILASILAPHAFLEHALMSYLGGAELTVTLLIVVLTYRIFMARVSVNESGIEVVNPFHRTLLKWSEISTFRTTRFGRGFLVPQAVLHDGSTISLIALRVSVSARDSSHRLESAIGELKRQQAVASFAE